jgi:hypothetical protein
MDKENTTGVNVVKSILTVLDGSFLTRENMLRNVPFILFLFGLGILYIANSHYAERCVIMTNRTEKELKELRSEFITNRSDLMTALKQSEMAKAVEPMGIVESRVPAKKILVNEPEKLH